MNAENINSFTIVHHSGAFQRFDQFFTFITHVTRSGVIRLSFERGIPHSDSDKFGGRYHLPVVETYEYRIDQSEVERKIFSQFDLLALEPHPQDVPGCDMGSWEMTIQMGRSKKRLEGFLPPEPYGEELSKAICKLLAFRMKPLIW